MPFNLNLNSGGSGASGAQGTTNDAGFLAVVNTEAEFNALSPVAKDWIRVDTEFLIGGAITFGVGYYYYDGSGWQIIALDSVSSFVDWVSEACYIEPASSAYDVGNASNFLDEITAAQLATLPSGAHVRWTAPQDVTLNTMRVARLGAATSTTISWESSTGVSGSDTQLGDGNIDINLGGVELAAGDTIDFTLVEITGGQMQLATVALAQADGWTALQDYSGFATTSFWTNNLSGFEGVSSQITIRTNEDDSLLIVDRDANTLTPTTQAFVDTLTPCPDDVPKVDADSINEYINNLDDYYVVFAKENFARTIANVNINGVNATFDNLENAVDNGDGSLLLSTTNNGNFNARASTSEFICKCDDYIEITTPAGGNFTTIQFSLSTDPLAFAEQNGNELRVFLGGSNWSLLDTGGNVLESGTHGGSATYRFTRTLVGFSVEREGVEIYSTPVPDKPVNYRIDPQPIVNGASGVYRVGDRHEQLTPIANDNTTNIVTGHDLTQAGDLTLRFQFADESGAHLWQMVQIDANEVLERFNASAAQDGSLTLFSDDYGRINVIDPATGEFQFIDTGRDFSYLWSELYVVADNLSSSDNHSSSEQVVGRWIDGSDICQVSVQGGALSTGSNTIATLGAFDSLISLEVYVKNGNNWRATTYNTGTSVLRPTVDSSNGVVNVQIGSDWGTIITDHIMVIQYTK